MLFVAFGFMSYITNAQTELIYDKYDDGIYQNGIRLTSKEVKELMKDNKDALSKYKSGRIQYITGKCIFYPFIIPVGLGLVFIMAGVADAEAGILGNEFYYIAGGVFMLGGGVGMLIGYWTYDGGERKIKQAVGLYNANINNNKVSVNFGLTGNGVGLSIGF